MVAVAVVETAAVCADGGGRTGHTTTKTVRSSSGRPVARLQQLGENGVQGALGWGTS